MTPRSWVIMMIAVPNSSCSVFMTCRTWACTVTSSAVVGSSAMSSAGFSAIAIAIMARCRIPPENWCGKSSTRRSGCGMPTIRSRSTARARAWAFDMAWSCSRIISLICQPTL